MEVFDVVALATCESGLLFEYDKAWEQANNKFCLNPLNQVCYLNKKFLQSMMSKLNYLRLNPLNQVYCLN